MLFSSCEGFNRPDSFSGKASFMEYVDKTASLKKNIVLDDGVQISAMFLPCTVVGGEDTTSARYQDNLYLLLSFSKDGKELLAQVPKEEYSAMLHMLSFGMESTVSLLADENVEEIYPLAAVFQPTYGMGNSNDVLISFERAALKDKKQVHVRFKDFDLQSNESKFVFLMKDVNYVANLKILNP